MSYKPLESLAQNYAYDRHLIVFCNMDGSTQEDKLAEIVSKGRFGFVTIFGFNDQNRQYPTYVFDKNKPHAPIYQRLISETWLIDMAKDLPEKPVSRAG